MTDAGKDTLRLICEDFRRRCEADRYLANMAGELRFQTAYAKQAGYHMAEAIKAVLGDGNTLDADDMRQVLTSVLGSLHGDVVDTATAAQIAADRAMQLTITPIKPKPDYQRIGGLTKHICEEGIDLITQRQRIDGGVVNYSQNVLNDWMDRNADQRDSMGLRCVVRRTLSNSRDACDWCKKLAGTYEYSQRPAEFFQQHSGCTCSIEYRSERTYSKLKHGRALTRRTL